MKIKNVTYSFFQTLCLIFLAALFIIFSKNTRKGAYDGLNLAMNTVVPSLLPLLIIFLTFMKSSAKAFYKNIRLFSRVFLTCQRRFRLLSHLGGYPTVHCCVMNFEAGEHPTAKGLKL
ncbi:MAG: hypothetical protein ACLR9J_03185 [Eubacterium sp.]